MSKGMQVWSAGISAYKALQGLSWWSSVKTPMLPLKEGCGVCGQGCSACQINWSKKKKLANNVNTK